jgi:hypothetical protein
MSAMSNCYCVASRHAVRIQVISSVAKISSLLLATSLRLTPAELADGDVLMPAPALAPDPAAPSRCGTFNVRGG